MTFHPDTAPGPAGWGASAGSGVVYLSRVMEWAAHGAALGSGRGRLVSACPPTPANVQELRKRAGSIGDGRPIR
jgi:hypothetical protein